MLEDAFVIVVAFAFFIVTRMVQMSGSDTLPPVWRLLAAGMILYFGFNLILDIKGHR